MEEDLNWIGIRSQDDKLGLTTIEGFSGYNVKNNSYLRSHPFLAACSFLLVVQGRGSCAKVQRLPRGMLSGWVQSAKVRQGGEVRRKSHFQVIYIEMTKF